VAIVVATPTVETVTAIYDALERRVPIAMLHEGLSAAEHERQRAMIAEAKLPDDAACVLFTSGSTAAPRGVVLSRDALIAAAEASTAHLGWRDDDRWLVALSLAHAGGLAIVVRCLAARRPIALLERAPLARALEGCTLASLVPTQLAALLDDPAWRPPPRLRAVLLGGAAASPALLDAAAARGVPFLTTYGMTESFGQLATAPLSRAGDPAAPLVPLPGVELVAGARAAPAVIRARAPMLATCYLDGAPIAPELATADLGFVEAGELHVVGRADDVIVTGGENVHPAMIEAVLAATRGVRAACAFGIADDRWGQIVGAAIAIDDTFDLSSVDTWHTVLPPHARPRELAVVRELPEVANGKVDRRAAARLPREPVRYR
jgi:O-succinylbenzoic acid--CoA ligase